jgi:ribosomal protein L33
MLIKHRPSHLTQGFVFPFYHTIIGRRIRTRKLVFKIQVMAKGFEARVSEFRAIVTADRSYGISVSLVPQPQDKISNKTKRLPFLLKKEHPRIPRVFVHHNKDVPLPTRRSHTSWANKVHMEQLAWTLSHHISERRVREATILACLHGAQTNYFSSLNHGNPQNNLSLLKRDKRSKLK